MKNQSLTFSKYIDRDFGDYYALVKNDAVMRYITGKGLSEQQAREKFNSIIEINNREREIGYFKVYAGKQFIGDCKLVRYRHNRDVFEIGYLLKEAFWRQGYGTEICRKMLDRAQNIAPQTEVIAVIHSENTASKRLLEKFNFSSYFTGIEDGVPTEKLKRFLPYVITGGPGVGKTALITNLRQLGLLTAEEDARRIISEQMAIGGSALPWKDKARYAQLMLEASVKTFNEMKALPPSKFVFFDRGILDAVCYMNMENIPVTPEIKTLIHQYTYNRKVFILPPWKEIYTTDSERKQSWEEAVFTFTKMKETYSTYGYTLIEVPKVPVHERVLFVLNAISD